MQTQRLIQLPLFVFAVLITATAVFGQDDTKRLSLYLEEGKSGAVWDCAIAADGATLFSCGRDSTAKAWNTTTGEGIRTFRLPASTLVTCIAVSPDGKAIATGDMNGIIAIWDAQLGQLQKTYKAHDAYIIGIEFTPTGRSLVTAGRDDMVYVWDVQLGTRRISIDAQSIWVNAIALSPDGEMIATAGQDGSIKSWDTYSGKKLLDYGTHSRFARCVTFSRDSKKLISGGRSGVVKVWDSKSGVFLRSFQVESGYPHELTADPSSGNLVVSTANGVIEVWNWQAGSRSSILGAASYGAMSSVLSPDGKKLYTTHVDGAIKVWLTKDWIHIMDMVGFSDGQWLTFTPDGFYDCSAFGDRYVQWKSGEDFYPLARYEAIYKKPGIVEDALAERYTSDKTLTDIVDPPSIRMIAPRARQIYAFGSEPLEIVVEAEASDISGIESIAIAINGRLLETQQIISMETVTKSATTLRQKFRIAVLPGYNTVDMVAYNDLRIRSEVVSAVARVMTSSKRKSNLYLLAVGIDDYAPAFPNLKFASNDAAALAETFSRQEGTMYERVYTKVLANRDATRSRILGALDEFPPMSSQDVLIMFFSGHGIRARNKRTSSYYFVSSGATKQNITNKGLSWSDFATRLNQTRAGRVVLLLDACHSGAVSEGASNEKVAASLSDKVGVVFASSSGNEFSFEDASWRHGAFTKAILGALSGEADYTKDNIIDWNEFQLNVTNTVTTLTKGSQHPMIPRLEQFGNFDLVRVQ